MSICQQRQGQKESFSQGLYLDLRSDTVTQPTANMRAAMAKAVVGDDVWGDDPTVQQLEAMAAALLGKEAALFVASGTAGNLLALLCHLGRGDEYIVGQDYHCYKYEAGGAAVLGSIQPQPLEVEPDGSLALESIAKRIKPDDFHFAPTRLLALENTHYGRVLSLDYLRSAAELARAHGLALHLDGARIFNAATKLGVPAAVVAAEFDSVNFCLSKGLAAPVGSLLCASAEIISQARRWRKMIGGAMRQAGVLAAAGIVALQEQIPQLAVDHANAARLGSELARIDALQVNTQWLHSNMVWLRVPEAQRQDLYAYLLDQAIKVDDNDGAEYWRLVTHKDIDAAGVDKVIAAFQSFFS